MKRIAINLVRGILRIYWRIFKPVTLGARAIIVDEKGMILLVKHTYQDYWYFPGGGVKRNETFGQAVKRELIEEVGYEAGVIELFGVYNSTNEGKRDNIVLFICRDGKFIKSPRSIEIEKYEFFSPGNLPENTSPATRKRIEEFYNSAKSNNHFGLW